MKIEQLLCSAEGPWAVEWEHLSWAVTGRRWRPNVFVYRFEAGRIAQMWMICAAPAGSESIWN